MPLLEIRELTKNFNGIKALDRLTFDVNEREIVALIGPNGSGKTVCFNLISRLYPPEKEKKKSKRARIYFMNRELDLLDYSPHEVARYGIGRTFQTSRLFLKMSVLENVLVGMHARLHERFWSSLLGLPRMRQIEDAAVKEAFDVMSAFGDRLTIMANEPALALSQANRRRLEIARALASYPKLLLLDEPSGGMNPSETKEIQEEIRKIRERGLTILLIEHKMGFVRGLADKVVVLNQGERLAVGTFDDVSRNPQVQEAYFGEG